MLLSVCIQIENVLRQDLAKRFHHCQQRMTSALAESERRNPRMYNLKTQVAFHGTPTRSLPSIGGWVCVGGCECVGVCVCGCVCVCVWVGVSVSVWVGVSVCECVGGCECVCVCVGGRE